MMLFSSWCRNSIGSSTVMTFLLAVLLISLTIAASVVDLPLPTVPVTKMSPRCRNARFLRIPGNCSSSMFLMFTGTWRKTMAIDPRWT